MSTITYPLSTITYHLSPITYHLLPTTYYLLPTTYYLPPTTPSFHRVFADGEPTANRRRVQPWSCRRSTDGRIIRRAAVTLPSNSPCIAHCQFIIVFNKNHKKTLQSIVLKAPAAMSSLFS
ncbi:MAG: hypothetical protein MJZ65_00620 [Paludibacteraceae bacterium]|nr:hypothetical protein [Paludibacteraceae bacterium]